MYGVIIEKGPQNWQVLQQQNGWAEVPLGGRLHLEADVLAHADGRVVVRCIDENNGLRVTAPVMVKPQSDQWEAVIRLPVGGPYRIEAYYRYNGLCEKRGDRIFHMGVGDVYVIAGQSNAVGVGKDAAEDVPSPAVRMFRLCGQWDMATHPLHDSTATLFPLSQEKAQTGHSPWLSFAKALQQRLGYPIGLIPATKGGIPLSCWDRAQDGAFFDNMLDIVQAAGGKVKGILWVHGCNDLYDGALRRTYLERFRRVCADFESVFYPGIPILTVQLNKATCVKGKDLLEQGVNWADIREAQRRAMHEIGNVYMAPAIDLPVCDGIHNAAVSNIALGGRVAALALKHVYGVPVAADAPDIVKAAKAGESTASLTFSPVYDALCCDLNRNEALMFSLTDEEGRRTSVDYQCAGDSILLTFDGAIGKHAVVSCDGYNESGLMPYDLYTHLPVIPFSGIEIGDE